MKFGRKPAVHTARTFRRGLVLARHLDWLGPAPTVSNDYVSKVTVPWGMMLNDSLGDCVCADTGHALMLRTANAYNVTVVPVDENIKLLYKAVGGYVDGDPSTDNGCDETSMEEYLEATGFMGHKSSGTGMVDPNNLDHLRWSVQLFGTCRLGINFPAYAMNRFDAGQPWSAVAPGEDATIEGGHDVPLVGYSGDAFLCVTWGKLQTMMPDFLAAYCEEAHAAVFADWTNAQGLSPPGLDLAALVADLKNVAT